MFVMTIDGRDVERFTTVDAANAAAGEARAIDATRSIVVSDDAPSFATVEELREALAVLAAGKDAADEAAATAKDVVLSRYRFHALRIMQRVERRKGTGVDVLPEELRKELSRKLWVDAGRGDTPKAADRTTGEKSFATYVSRLHTVATDIGYGIAATASWADVDAARKGIAKYRKASAEAAAVTVASVAHDDYLSWVASLPAPDRAALARARALLSGSSVGVTHAEAFKLAVMVDARNAGLA